MADYEWVLYIYVFTTDFDCNLMDLEAHDGILEERIGVKRDYYTDYQTLRVSHLRLYINSKI